jgi:hypothetical protein
MEKTDKKWAIKNSVLLMLEKPKAGGQWKIKAWVRLWRSIKAGR